MLHVLCCLMQIMQHDIEPYLIRLYQQPHLPPIISNSGHTWSLQHFQTDGAGALVVVPSSDSAHGQLRERLDSMAEVCVVNTPQPTEERIAWCCAPV